MPANTPNLALPYPLAADTADVPRDIQALATKLDGLGAWTVPAYNAPWTGDVPPARYRKRPDGIVELEGLIKANGAAFNTVVFTLPVGFRPLVFGVFAVCSNAGINNCQVDVTGTLIIAGAVTWAALSSIRFPTI